MVDVLGTIAACLMIVSLIIMVIAFQVHLYREAYVRKGWLCGTTSDKVFFWAMLPMTSSVLVFIVAVVIDGFQVGAL